MAVPLSNCLCWEGVITFGNGRSSSPFRQGRAGGTQRLRGHYHPAATSGHFYTFRCTATDNTGNSASATASAGVAQATKYYYAAGQRVAQRRGGVLYYLHADHLGSVSLVTNASGGVVARQLYEPFGTVRYGGTLPTDFGFAGQRHDSTGLIFMHARYYHPALGRWTQADTIVPGLGNSQSLNRYAYCLGNPLKYTDPTGHLVDSGGGGGNDEDKTWPDPGGMKESPSPTVPSGSPNISSYTPQAANAQAWWIIRSWFFEVGREHQSYGPGSPFSQILMHHAGVVRIREEWRADGCPNSYKKWASIEDVASNPWLAFGQVNVEMLLSLLGYGSPTPDGPINPVGGVLGSYRVRITNLGNGYAMFVVENETTLASGTRIPGTGWSVLPELERSETDWVTSASFVSNLLLAPSAAGMPLLVMPAMTAQTRLSCEISRVLPGGRGGVGGNTTQYFWWIEPIE